MSSEKIFLNREEQIFLMEMLETQDIEDAVYKFSDMMAKQGADPVDMKKYIVKIMRKYANSK